MKAKIILIISILLGILGLERGISQTPVPLGMEDVIWQKEGLSVYALAFSPTQSYVAVGVVGEIILFDIQSGSEIRRLNTSANQSMKICFSNDGKYLYNSSDLGLILKWDTETWDSIKIDSINLPMFGVVRDISINNQNDLLAVACDVGLFVYNTLSNQKLIEWKDMPIVDPKFDRKAAVTSVSFRNDGKVLAIGMKDADATWLYDIENDSIIKKIKGEDGQYSPTKNELIVKKIKEESGSDILDGLDYYKFDDSDIQTYLNIDEFNNELGTFKYNSLGNKLIIAGKFGNIVVFDLNLLLEKFNFKIIDKGVNPTFANISNDNKYLLTMSGGILYLVDIDKYTDIESGLIINKFKTYPNPSLDSIIIEYYLDINCNINISISDLQGIILSNIFSGFQEQGQHNLPFSTINIANGHYFITIESNGQVISLPFEIAR